MRHKAISIYSIGLMLSHLAFGIGFDTVSVSAQVGESMTHQIVSLTNSERQKVNLPALKENSQLQGAAIARAKDMFAKDYWDHFAPDGKEPWEAIKEAGYNYSYAGENLAKGFSDANSTVNAWMNSQTHKDNLLNSNYEDIGIAVVSDSFKGRNTTIIVQLFAAPFERGVKPVTVLGAKSETKQLNLASMTSSQNIPYTAAWAMIALMLLADGWMLYKQGHHKDKHHRFHFGLASILMAALFSLLTVQVSNIL
ncbi:MAG: hypothetical protein UU65_C0001G0231 [candidate division CPR2 bacterium GW2011_GWC1_41_48]|uniref:SCP domain-containing protein n=1 Tax=candidate division CPR2 bacterium GW2011_GWC1_41_48 TaxID=1618344 RepID=A0A0G0YJW0_UNCC2|nr:MAG: hypothetical protein UT47_C0001G0231 [candidate division CPR2 bacterium GW2011_GWC2_39_35]KKR28116.1 MAG: hypothetical protein UT60_C0027G0006 [candidate division CPR2 bacterium GW2011_GWD2_39_7]KKR29559.1 MAG: hypothetical protein UT59_C0005G0014 [candidate division CPR2 bacterium GW2011_GWD1_39_7]KKS09826.1 MAG: hypothetical protein UU65_C0001G0231 [candidate division CPR2 bacterium GW2011_GWC1_41_48]